MSLTETMAWEIWWDYVCEFRDFVEGMVHSAKEDELQRKLPQNDWFLYLISNVLGLRENCGSLVDGLASFAEYQNDLELALRRFGFPVTAANVQTCIDFVRDPKEQGEWTQDLQERRDLLEQKCHWSFSRLIDYLRCHDEDFSHSILPYYNRRQIDGQIL